MAGFDKMSVSAYWTDAAEKDYEVFGLLLGAGKNCKALYSGYRVIENYMRAIFARRHNRHAPRHVNLCHLSYLCGPGISAEFSEWMDGTSLFLTTERKGDFSREVDNAPLNIQLCGPTALKSSEHG